MSEDGYQGWANHATWCVHLWLTSEEPTYRTCRVFAQECRDEAPTASQVKSAIWTQEEAARILLADRLREMVEEGSPHYEQASMYSDLLTSALQDVDWHEVADAFLEE